MGSVIESRLNMSSSQETPLAQKTSLNQEEAIGYVPDDIARTAHYTDYVDTHISQWEAVRKYPWASLYVLAAVFILICTSFESQAGGIVIAITAFRRDFGYQAADGSYVIAAKWISCFSGVPLAAQIVGQWTGSWLADRWGKRWVIFGALVVSCGFVGIEFASKTVQIFLLGKTLNGFCLGIVQALCVSYVADIAPLPMRGGATNLCNVSFSIGPLICFVINYSQSNNLSRWAYRSIFAAQWGFAVVSLGILLVLPESPAFFVLKDHPEKAHKAYMRILGDPLEATQQCAVLQDTVKEAEKLSSNSSYIDCFKGTNLKRTIACCMPFIYCPFSGVYFTASYTSYWFQLAGYTESMSFKLTIAAQVCSILGCLAASIVSGKFPRRSNLIYGTTAILIIDLLIGTTGINRTNQSVVKTTVAFMILYGGIYNFGLGSVCYTIATENPTAALRTKTVGIALSSSGMSGMVWSFVIPYLFLEANANLQAKTMLVFFGFSVLFLIYFFFFIPETQGRTMHEIDELYATGVPLRKFHKTQTESSKINEESYMAEKSEIAHHEYA